MTEHPQIARAKKHLGAVITDAKGAVEDVTEGPSEIKWFMAGVLGGLSVAAHILGGKTADEASEVLEQNLYAAFGKALLEGKIPADAIKDADA